MTAPARSHRRPAVLLIWCGGVAMALAGAFTLAWVKLPEWQPEWVMEHSPWADPGVRAIIAAAQARHFDSLPEPVLRWGDGIGPVLVARYQRSDAEERKYSLFLSLITADQLTTDDERAEPYRRLSEAEVWHLRSDLLGIAKMAMASGHEADVYSGIGIALQLRGHEMIPEVDRFLRGLKARPRYKDVVVEYCRQVGDVEGLLLLLPWFEGNLYRTDIMAAVADCLTPDPKAPAVMPKYDPAQTARPWALMGRRRAVPEAAVRQRIVAILNDTDPTMRMVAAEAVGAGHFSEALPRLIELFDSDPSIAVRRNALEAIAALSRAESRALLRRVVDAPEDPLRNVAVTLLGGLRDPADFPRLFALLDDDDVSGKARQSLAQLPLTPDQRRQVDERWAAITGEETEPLTSPAAASPPIP
ncbi:MAG: HEAT repeat domain-containing protein [Planctomycetes bacterium]|jgi:hypothetical protein|nr:HEAT repeat domain-containing protein [Planctomycetota bacterium]